MLCAALVVALLTLGSCAPFTLSDTSYKQGVGEGLWTYTVPPLANGNNDYYLEIAICDEFLNTTVRKQARFSPHLPALFPFANLLFSSAL